MGGVVYLPPEVTPPPGLGTTTNMYTPDGYPIRRRDDPRGVCRLHEENLFAVRQKYQVLRHHSVPRLTTKYASNGHTVLI